MSPAQSHTILDTLCAHVVDALPSEIMTGAPSPVVPTSAEASELLDYIANQQKRIRRLQRKVYDASRDAATGRRKLAEIEETAADTITVLANLRAQLRHPTASHTTSFDGYADLAGRAAHQLAALLGEVRQ